MRTAESNMHPDTVEEGLVPAATYFAWVAGRLVGTIQLRYELNDYLLTRGGHIGYGVRPSERRKGYASAMLGQVLAIARELGIDRVLITCDEDNVASARTIMRCGGVLENEHTDDEGKTVKRYWIDLSRHR